MSKREALFGSHFGPNRPDARFDREDGPACVPPIHSAMNEQPGFALSGGMTRRSFLATAAAGFGMVVTACATGCSGLPDEVGLRDFDATGHASLATVQDSERGTHRISIVMGGDVLAHRGIWMSGERADGTRNYDHLFSAIAPTFKSADIAIVNQETVLGGVEMGLSGSRPSTVPRSSAMPKRPPASMSRSLRLTMRSTRASRGLKRPCVFGAKGILRCSCRALPIRMKRQIGRISSG